MAATYTCGPGSRLHLEVSPSHTNLREGDTYDMASIRIRILDEHGNIAPYAQLPVQFTLEGDAELVGPNLVTAEGGMTGTYVKTTGKAGEARLTIHTDMTEDVTLIFKIAVDAGFSVRDGCPVPDRSPETRGRGTRPLLDFWIGKWYYFSQKDKIKEKKP